jgi:succinate dehydrogenase / fumarate reductase, cytochrome b subunit
MNRFSATLLTSVGKKIFMAVTGLALSGFIVVHLTGNFALLNPDKDPFNKYAHFLLGLGPLLYTAEIILVTIFLIHFIYALVITINNWRAATPGRYKVSRNAGHASKKSMASTTMVYTGILIMTFLVLHLLHFKYGEVLMYTTRDGVFIRDLYTLVYNFFGNVWNVTFYTVIMALLGFHLSHGFWSAFQSLGINGVVFTRLVYGFGYLFAVVMAVGFLFLPLYIFVTSGGLR